MKKLIELKDKALSQPAPQCISLDEAKELAGALQTAINWHYATLNDSDEPPSKEEREHGHLLDSTLSTLLTKHPELK